MFSIIKSLVKKGLRKRGYQIVSNSNLKQDPVVQAEFGHIQNKIDPLFIRTSRKERIEIKNL